MIPESEQILSKAKETLTQQEGEQLLQQSLLFKKFLNKSKFSYQLALSTGKHRGKEERIYTSMDVCDELIASIDSIEFSLKKWRDEQEKAQKEREEKAKK